MCVCVNRPCPRVGGAREGQESRTVPYGDLSLLQGLGPSSNIKYMGGRHVKVLPAPTCGFKMQGQFWLPYKCIKGKVGGGGGAAGVGTANAGGEPSGGQTGSCCRILPTLL